MPACSVLCRLSVTSTATHSKLGPSGADSQVGGFVYILGLCRSFQQTLLWGLEFLLLQQPLQIFTARGFEALFPLAGSLSCVVCVAPQLFFLLYFHTNVGLPSLPATALPTQSSGCCFVMSPLHPGCPSAPLLPVWMNVSSLTPWLSDFHTVWLLAVLIIFLFLNLLFFFFWLCEDTKCIYLCLYLGRKSNTLSLLITYLFIVSLSLRLWTWGRQGPFLCCCSL